MTGQNDRQTQILSGQIVILAGHCPVTGRYFEPCFRISFSVISFYTHKLTGILPSEVLSGYSLVSALIENTL